MPEGNETTPALVVGTSIIRDSATWSSGDVDTLSCVFHDTVTGIGHWTLWSRLGWAEVRRRYRRTVVGPFWSSLSLAVFVLTMGLLYSALWKISPATYLPFLSSGMICWVLVSALMTEGCVAFIGNSSLITQLPFNLATLACAVVWRNVIVLFHNLAVYIVIALVVGVDVNLNTLLVIPGLLLLAVNGLWVCMILGLLCARYRDIQQVVTSLLQVSLFLTPIFWAQDQLGGRGHILAAVNPLFHLVEVVRAPLLGKAPELLTYGFLLGLALVGWTITLAVFRRHRHYIAFWV